MQRRPGKSARQRAEERGWVFWPVNPMPTLIDSARHQRAHQRAENQRAAARARLAAGDRPDEPLGDDERVYNYVRQNGITRPLTRRQQRRRRHKNHRANG